VIPVFPLDGVVLLPRCPLPLNVFEPRYLNMVDDALGAARLIGVVQTLDGMDKERPLLAPVGCVGRLTAFSETPDGRYVITLNGLCRFRVGRELSAPTPYRQVEAQFAPFAADFKPEPEDGDFDRAKLLDALRRYLDAQGLEMDWESAEQAPLEALTNSLSMALPLDPPEKQMLLEAASLARRRELLTTMLAIDAASSDDDDTPPMQ
jgi:hypothetical protein